MSLITVYNTYSRYLEDKYGEKVYKLPLNLPLTCPNRDGTLGHEGCAFCGKEGGSFENLSSTIPIKDQLDQNRKYIGEKYKAKKFIAYFQNFTNTYMPFEDFKNSINEVLQEDIVEIAIATRPDCINEKYLEYLSKIKNMYNIDITIELGLQTVNYKSLIEIKRGHTLAEYIDASLKIKRYDLRNCTHLILNLPGDEEIDVIENAKVLSALGVDCVKLHALYIMDHTALGEMYKSGKIQLISKEAYMERVILFLEYLDPDITIQRLIGRAPEDDMLFVNWNESWWKIRDTIVAKMEERKTRQGSKFDYLDGKGIKKF